MEIFDKYVKENYDTKNRINNLQITSDIPTLFYTLTHNEKEYDVINFKFANTRNGFVLFDTQTQPKQMIGYAIYDFNEKNGKLALQRFAVLEELRGNKIGRAFLKAFDEMIFQNFGQKITDRFVNPSSATHQISLEEFYKEFGFKLTKLDPCEHIFDSENDSQKIECDLSLDETIKEKTEPKSLKEKITEFFNKNTEENLR